MDKCVLEERERGEIRDEGDKREDLLPSCQAGFLFILISFPTWMPRIWLPSNSPTTLVVNLAITKLAGIVFFFFK